MNLRDLLAKLSSLGVQLWVDEDQLGVRAPRGVLTPDLRAQLAEGKRELLALLRNNPRHAAGAMQRIQPAKRDGEIPLSFAQKRIWFIDQLDPGTPAYNCPFAYRLRGEVNVPALSQAVGELTRRHESLRTTFAARGGRPLQIISPTSDVEITLVDLSDLPSAEREARGRGLAAAETQHRFDLRHGPLLRCSLVRLHSHEHLLLITLHHIIVDGWSYVTFLRELTEIYAASVAGRSPALDQPRLQYADFAIWEQKSLPGEPLERRLEYWRRQFDKGVPILELPRDAVNENASLGVGQRQVFETPATLAHRLDELCQRENATLFAALLAAYGILLHRYSGQNEIVVGSPIAARTEAECEGMIGCFMNPLPIRLDLSGEPTFRQLLGRVRQVVMDALAYQDTPFDALAQALRPERKRNQTPLFQTMFLLHNYPQMQNLALAGLDVEYVDLGDDLGAELQYPLVMEFARIGGSIFGILSYHPDYASILTSTVDQFHQLLDQVTANPNLPIREVSLLSKHQRQQVLIDWNRTTAAYPETRCIHQLFEARVQQQPNAIAVSCDGDRLTYGDLNRRSNQLAHYLVHQGIRPGDVVACCLERSIDMIATILGILKAGGAYLPLDPQLPAERRMALLSDARVSALVTVEEFVEGMSGSELPAICLDADGESIRRQHEANPSIVVTPHHLAYLMYTSGSTGQPKAVMVQHRSLVHYAHYASQAFAIVPADRVLQFASISFDAAAEEIYPCLLQGATLVLRSSTMTSSLPAFLQACERERLTVIDLPTAFWHQLTDRIHLDDCFFPSCVRLVIIGGEEARSECWARWSAVVSSSTKLVNTYGPTESTIVATTCDLPPEKTNGSIPVPIGRPIANMEAYVLDPQLQPTPIAVPGELYLGGAGVAAGYWDRPSLTGERFVPHPFSDEKGARLYRTGDRARYLPDGNLQFLGRMDRQVKLRGFRIEPGEVEAVLRQQPPVRDCAVVVRENESHDQHLIAYVVLEHQDALLSFRQAEGLDEAADERDRMSVSAEKAAALRSQCAARLPDYMVPSAIVFLDELPQTTSGKLDPAALPDPDRQRQVEPAFVAPRNNLEKKIAAIWQAVLNLDEVGVRDNFFDLGGHSLLLVELHARLVEQLKGDVSLINLYEHPTIESLAASLGGGDRPNSDYVEQARTRVRQRRAVGRDHTDIAIVGMAGRFPLAPDVHAFWEILRRGVEAIHFFGDDEIRHAGIDPAILDDPNYVKAFAVLDGIDRFDASFFGYSPREAELIDPQQRLFLECAWNALEAAGYDPKRCGEQVGVYAGTSMNTYLLSLTGMVEQLSAARGYLLSSDKDYLATRVAYKLDLHGPAVTVQAACATSLLAVNQAWQALQNYECDLALAGGVSAVIPAVGHLYDDQYIFSPDGHCRPFDIDAEGTLAGSGVAAVVLKRLTDALDDGDEIHAVIKGTAANNDGSQKVGYAAPSVDGQAQVIALAQATAGVRAESIGYIEAHGTGTKVGDPIEIAALTKVFREQTSKRQFCAIGSLKSNVGHLDAAAGVAGLIKTVLALKNRQIPASLNFRRANPKIDFDQSPFFVNAALRAWESPAGMPRRAGVSSFGIGGTNVHVILEEAPGRGASSASRNWQLLPLSAKTPTALERMGNNLAAHLKLHPQTSLPDVAYTLQVGRQQFDHRRVVVCNHREQAIAALETASAANAASRTTAAQQPQVVFLMPGQGSQYPGMGRELYYSERVFGEIIDYCADRLEQHLGWDIRELLLADEPAEDTAARLQQPAACQAALFSLELALARQWIHWGVRPVACLGHSIGEYVAACIGNALDVDDALALVARRGQLMQQAPSGAMLTVAANANEVAPLLGNDLWLAADNGPSLCVISGTPERIGQIQHQLQERQIQCRRLHTGGAYHSGLMQEAVEPLIAMAGALKRRRPEIPYLSNVTGTWITEQDLADPNYWGRHLTSTVRFREAASKLLELRGLVLLEVGPGQTLSTLIRQQAANGQYLGPILNSLSDARQPHPDQLTMTRALGGLWLEGVQLDWSAYYEEQQRHRVELPTYPFQRDRFWISPLGVPSTCGTSTRKTDLADWFYQSVWEEPAAQEQSEQKNSSARSAHLLFSDRSPIARQIAEGLRAAGDRVCEVYPGDSYRRIDESHFEINARHRVDYIELVHELKESGCPPTAVTHIWAGRDDALNKRSSGAGDDASDGLDRGFLSLIYLAQALSENEVAHPVHLDIITRRLHATDSGVEVDPSQATVMGPCRVFPQEYPHLVCRNRDLVPLGDGSCDNRDLDFLLADIRSGGGETVVAYRRGRRLIQRFEPKRLEPNGQALPGLLRRRGVYLITGGLGGIGLDLAKELIESCQARLILTSRSGLPDRQQWPDYLAERSDGDFADNGNSQRRLNEAPEKLESLRNKIRAVEALEASGTEVLVMAADVADESQMRRVIERAVERFGRIDGVIHSAGVPGGGMVQLKKPGVAARVLAPKVTGAQTLQKVLADMSLDFLILASSSTSILGGPGQVDYCAANAYLDAYASHLASRTGTYCVAINWGPWRDAGMAVSTELPESMREAHTAFLREAGISSADGRAALQRILDHRPGPQVVVSPINPFRSEPDSVPPVSKTTPGRSTTVRSTGKLANIDDWIYVPAWTRWPRATEPSSPEPLSMPGRWLIFLDKQACAEPLVQRLRSANHSVICVVPAEQFKRLGEDRYHIRVDKAEDYEALIQDLRRANRTPHRVIHLWGISQPSGDAMDDPRARRDFARCYAHDSLLLLTQALASISPMRIVLVTSRVHEIVGSETLSPETAATIGLARVIPQENSDWSCRCIDVEAPRGDVLPDDLVENLLCEVTSDAAEPTVAFRNGYRWVQNLRPFPLAATDQCPARLRAGGVYWITGGLGDIGLKMAEYLAKTVQANLILTGRTGLPPEERWGEVLAASDPADGTAQRIRRVQRLTELGAEVLVLCADAADPHQMKQVLNRTRDHFGTLHGVIHAAGLLGAEHFSPIAQTDRQRCAEQLRPKLEASYVLADLLHDQELDFCLLISSLSSFLGGRGYAPYAAANAAMDTLAYIQSRSSRCPWITVNWDSWIRAEDEVRLAEADLPVTGFVMSEAEGIGALHRILSYDVGPQVIVSTGDLQERIDTWVTKRQDSQPAQEATETRHPRPILPSEYEAPRTEIEQTLADIWADLFGLEQVGIHDNFFELGGHSLMATQLASQLRETFDGHLSLERVFEAPTIAQLADLIMQKLLEAHPTATEEALLDELEALSDEEVERALATGSDSAKAGDPREPEGEHGGW